VFWRVQVFQKYSPGFKITPSGGFSLTKVALAQLGSDGAEARVAAEVGVMAGVSVVSRLGAGDVCAVVGVASAISVRDSPAWTVCATEVAIADCDEPQAETSNTKLINGTNVLYIRRSDITLPFCEVWLSESTK
jgi:hypothetical protein